MMRLKHCWQTFIDGCLILIRWVTIQPYIEWYDEKYILKFNLFFHVFIWTKVHGLMEHVFRRLLDRFRKADLGIIYAGN